VDVEAATARGIPVSNTPAYCTDEVASHAMTLILALARKLQIILPRTRAGEWDYNFTRPIAPFRGRTLGILKEWLRGREDIRWVEPDGGTIQVAKGTTFGYLPQEGLTHHGRTLFEEVRLRRVQSPGAA
jgi:hypothetical protein